MQPGVRWRGALHMKSRIPLTPIQLSAERLRHKYLNKMSSEDAKVLDRATHTIVQQVEAMKEMVNAFSDYARPPGINSQPLEMESIVSEVLDLYSVQVCNRNFRSISKPPVPSKGGSGASQTGGAQSREKCGRGGGGKCCTLYRGNHPGGVGGECKLVELRVSDNGPGFDDDTLSHLFEPYVTTKRKERVWDWLL